ncbi:MAG: DUF2183 domain-containing protein [Gammaproteobacteria bacterium]|nr:DUF2183 domain-containing protein [Gammaproteobacteria bacterium]
MDREKLNDILIDHGARLETQLERLWTPLRRRLRLDRPAHIAAYRGFANSDKLTVSGRVLANRPLGGPGEDDDVLDNLRNSIKRWTTHEISDTRVVLRCGKQQQQVRTDEEGYYTADFDISAAIKRGLQWLTVEAAVEQEGETITAQHRVVLPGTACRFLIISDLDDTVIETGVTSLLTAARLTFLGNARTRKPLAGVAALYTALQHGQNHEPVNPVFYVSSSPWNLYDLLRDFLELNNIPAGPLLLRDLGVDETRFIKRRGHLHKLENVLRILETYRDKPAILIGDSGQEDAQLYAEAVRQHPDRILSVYIRDVDPGISSEGDSEVQKAAQLVAGYGVDMVAAESTARFAEHAAQLGMLRWEQMPVIADAIRRDRQRPSLSEQSI